MSEHAVQFAKGQTAYVVEKNDSGEWQPHEAEVKSAGEKFITAQWDNGSARFPSLRCSILRCAKGAYMVSNEDHAAQLCAMLN